MWCPDQTGILARVANFFYLHELNILRSQNYAEDDRFFMRMVLDCTRHADKLPDLESAFDVLARQLQINWSVSYSHKKPNVAILVTKEETVLHELLTLQRQGELDCNVPFIAGNRDTLRHVAEYHDIPFHHLPITKGKKREQELQIEALCDEHDIDLVVLARYMQILTPEFCDNRLGQIINIHHGFLPAFQGAKPYHQAFKRGVKLVGATAHYVTAELDEGPIIEQDVIRISHQHTVGELVRLGRDIERRVLAKAVQKHLEHRIVIYGQKTIVF